MYTSDRIRLRFIERDDLEALRSWYDDAEVRRHLHHALPMSMAIEKRWFEAMLQTPLRENSFLIEAKTEAGWQAIGTCMLKQFDDLAGSAELGIMIGEKAFWRRGLGTETVRLLLWHGFENLNLHRVWLSVSAKNKGAIRCYEKAGMQLEAKLREAEYKNGAMIDTLLYGILKKEWIIREREDKNGN